MISFVVEVIPHDYQRYPTCGDYVRNKYDCIHVRVSDMGNADYEFLVGVHEMVEAYLAYRRGVKEEDIDAFDMAYERDRKPGDLSEPGDDTRCPIFREHQFATKIEKELAQELALDWDEYSDAVNELG